MWVLNLYLEASPWWSPCSREGNSYESNLNGGKITERRLNACVESMRDLSGDVNILFTSEMVSKPKILSYVSSVSPELLSSFIHTLVWFVGQRSDPAAWKLFDFTLLLLYSHYWVLFFFFHTGVQPCQQSTAANSAGGWSGQDELKPGAVMSTQESKTPERCLTGNLNNEKCSSITKLIVIKVFFFPFKMIIMIKIKIIYTQQNTNAMLLLLFLLPFLIRWTERSKKKKIPHRQYYHFSQLLFTHKPV